MKECTICNRDILTGRFCNSCRTNRRRKAIKEYSILYKGGQCNLCNYSKCMQSLCFHHLDPNQKDFCISSNHCRRLEDIVAELDKCILLCLNCHAEVHAGLHFVSIKNCLPSLSIPDSLIDSLKTKITTQKKSVLKAIKSQTKNSKVDNHTLCKCGKIMDRCSTLCIDCYKPSSKEKIEWLSDQELAKLVWQKPRTQLAKEFGVSDKAIAKRCNKLGIRQPQRGYWSAVPLTPAA